MKRSLFLGAVAGLGFVAVTEFAPADAAPRNRDRNGSVTVCSNFGVKCVSGPTRPGRFGPEVRMPGGTWIDCARNCADTLRVATIDFWAQREQERGGGGEWRR
jgi:hypothetical protein